MASEVSCSAPEIHLIGEIAVGFGNLEFYLESGIWQLLAGDDEQTRKLGEAITAEMSFDRKVHAFASLYRLKVPAGSDDTELKALVKSLFEAQENRNAILHSAWTYSEKWHAFTRMKASAKATRGLRRRMHRMSPERLEAIRYRIAEAGELFGKFVMQRVQDRRWRGSEIK